MIQLKSFQELEAASGTLLFVFPMEIFFHKFDKLFFESFMFWPS